MLKFYDTMKHIKPTFFENSDELSFIYKHTSLYLPLTHMKLNTTKHSSNIVVSVMNLLS